MYLMALPLEQRNSGLFLAPRGLWWNSRIESIPTKFQIWIINILLCTFIFWAWYGVNTYLYLCVTHPVYNQSYKHLEQNLFPFVWQITWNCHENCLNIEFVSGAPWNLRGYDYLYSFTHRLKVLQDIIKISWFVWFWAVLLLLLLLFYF